MAKNHDSVSRRVMLMNEFRENGCSLSGFAPEKALEMLLYDCSLKADQAESAASFLISRFGSVKRVFQADLTELTADGALSEKEAEAVKLYGAFISKMYIDRYKLPLKTDDQAVLFDYLKAVFFHESREKLYMFPLDDKGLIVRAYVISDGSHNSVRVNFTKILKFMFDGGDSGRFILAHNHPDNESAPSAEDISSTAFIKNKTLECGGEMTAHYVVGTDGVSEVPVEYNYAEFLFNKDKWDY